MCENENDVLLNGRENRRLDKNFGWDEILARLQEEFSRENLEGRSLGCRRSEKYERREARSSADPN